MHYYICNIVYARDHEVARWRVRWTIAEKRPHRLQDTLIQTSKDVYTCIYNILGVLFTLPQAAASYASDRLVLSTLSTRRISSLALLNIHKAEAVDIDNVINTVASMKYRTFNFF